MLYLLSGDTMKKVNLIVVLNKDESEVLMCKRTSNPYQGLYNYVGGKVEAHETSDDAAYRELFEETGITRNDIHLTHMIDYVYPLDDLTMNIYYGVLHHEVSLIPEKHPLFWFDVKENFMDKRFAGNGNTYHMLHCALYYLENKKHL